MPAYYKATIQEIDRSKAYIKMHLKVINLDATALSSRTVRNHGFALSLLDNFKLEGTDIRKHIGEDDLDDPLWQEKYAKGFILDFKINDIWMPIDDEVMKTYEETPELWEEATVEITCSDSAWISHLNVNDSWESYAYVVTNSFLDCAPIKNS